MPMVFAAQGNNPQGGEGSVGIDWKFNPTPDPLLFGTILPGDSGNVVSNLAVGTSNLQVKSIAITLDTGSVFTADNVKIDIDDGKGFTAPADVDPFVITNGGSKDINIKLNILAGTHSEDFTGTITYTVMEAP